MFVVPLMTVKTRVCGRLVAFGCVAALAVGVAMPSFQSKRRRVVIETDCLPRRLRVAMIAAHAQTALMRIFADVAVIAVRWGIAEALARQVAFVALHSGVAAPQRHIGEPVIERLSVQRDDACVATFVFGMTALTGAALYRRLLPMVSALFHQIGAHLLVAGEAQAVLRCLVERIVALVALTLEARMLDDQLTGHH